MVEINNTTQARTIKMKKYNNEINQHLKIMFGLCFCFWLSFVWGWGEQRCNAERFEMRRFEKFWEVIPGAGCHGNRASLYCGNLIDARKLNKKTTTPQKLERLIWKKYLISLWSLEIKSRSCVFPRGENLNLYACAP